MASDNFFEVESSAPLGFSKIVLKSGTAMHIKMGHPDIAPLLGTAVHETVSNPTEVYRGHGEARLIFVSSGVVRASGRSARLGQTKYRPLYVVVEPKADSGDVVTATWKDQLPRVKIWSSTSGLTTVFDRENDILYVTKAPVVEAYAQDSPDDEAIWLRRSFDDDAPVGVTVFGLAKREVSLEKVIAKASEFLGIVSEQIKDRVEAALTEKNA